MNRPKHPAGGDRYASLPPGVRAIGSSLGELSTRVGLAPPKTLHSVFSGWSALVGEPLADHLRPTSLRDGMLRVTADEAAWATQVKYLGQDLVDRINERLGEAVVVQIVVTVQGSRRPRGGSPAEEQRAEQHHEQHGKQHQEQQREKPRKTGEKRR